MKKFSLAVSVICFGLSAYANGDPSPAFLKMQKDFDDASAIVVIPQGENGVIFGGVGVAEPSSPDLIEGRSFPLVFWSSKNNKTIDMMAPYFVNYPELQRLMGNDTDTFNDLINPTNQFGDPVSQDKISAFSQTADGLVSIATPKVLDDVSCATKVTLRQGESCYIAKLECTDGKINSVEYDQYEITPTYTKH